MSPTDPSVGNARKLAPALAHLGIPLSHSSFASTNPRTRSRCRRYAYIVLDPYSVYHPRVPGATAKNPSAVAIAAA